MESTMWCSVWFEESHTSNLRKHIYLSLVVCANSALELDPRASRLALETSTARHMYRRKGNVPSGAQIARNM